MRRFLVILSTLAAAVPTVVLAQGRECTEGRPDVLARATPPIYRECEVTRPAERRGGHPPLDLPSSDYAALMQAGCLQAELGFVVDTRGRVEEGTVLLLETNQAAFGAAVVAVTGRLRFRPASLGEQPVRQWVTYRIEGRAPERVPFGVVRVDRMPALPPPSSRPVTVTLDDC